MQIRSEGTRIFVHNVGVEPRQRESRQARRHLAEDADAARVQTERPHGRGACDDRHRGRSLRDDVRGAVAEAEARP